MSLPQDNTTPLDYRSFLATKAVTVPLRGMSEVPPLAEHLFKFQRSAVEFGLRAGSWGLFFDTGLGKTACELEWCRHAAAASNGYALILTPLAVARQIEAEGRRWGYDAHVIREQSEARPGISICNYDRLHKLDPQAFGAIALDEASILKSFNGKTTRSLIELFAGHRWRMAATATPAPNDHMELGQYSEFLGIMPSNEMLMRWFITDQTEMGKYRLKGHAVHSFWDWMSSWCRMAERPADMGDDMTGFDLPPLKVTRHRALGVATVDGELFGDLQLSATDMHKVKRQTAASRAAVVGSLVRGTSDPWVVWCDTDYEANALISELSGESFVEVRGSHTADRKESDLASFSAGTARVIVSKPSVAGFGLNWQHCANVAFVGRSFSYESWYQAVRRCWRFGQQSEVKVHVVVADGEDSIGRVLDRKGDDHARMKSEMVAAMRRANSTDSARKIAYQADYSAQLPNWMRARVA